MADAARDWPPRKVCSRPSNGLGHKHWGSLHATDAGMALQDGRDTHAPRRGAQHLGGAVREPSPPQRPGDEGDSMLDPATPDRKPYRHPTFYDIPDEVGHM